MSNPRRSLRPREKPIDYSQLISFDTDQDIFEDNLDVPDADVQEGSSSGAIKRRVVIEDEDSGSEFDATAEPEVDQQWDDEEVIIDDVEPIDELALASEDNNGSISQSSRATAARSVVQRKNIVLAPGLARQSNRQMHARPLPAMHHRHRFMPLFHNTGLVEQMLAPPLPFKPSPPIGHIGSGTHDERISDRTGRSWSHNVGPGPVWEMVEDRAWYSEAVTGDEAEGKPWNEAFRRPLCYEDVNVRSEWEALSYDAAKAYLPDNTIKCYMGPVKQQVLVEVPPLTQKPMSSLFTDNQSHIFNAGGPIWGLDWGPIHPDHRLAVHHGIYLAVAPWPRDFAPHIGEKAPVPTPACIQIWSLRRPNGAAAEQDQGQDKDTMQDEHQPEVTCELVLCIDEGPAHEIRWCPLPTHSDLRDAPEEGKRRRLGYLAGTFSSGAFCVYEVPFPEDFMTESEAKSRYVYLKPLIRFALSDACCWSLAWANSTRLAVGCTNGSIAVFNIGKTIRNPENALRPLHYFSAHQAAIRSISWIQAPQTTSHPGPDGQHLDMTLPPDVILSAGYDGILALTPLSYPPLRSAPIMRTRDLLLCTAYGPFAGVALGCDNDGAVKGYSMAPAMFGRGSVLLEQGGPSWGLGTSEYHPGLAVAGADGSVVVTNLLRGTRRSGALPFLEHKIYSIQYSPKEGVWRMLERFLPRETPERSSTSRSRAAAVASDEPAKSTSGALGLWPPEQAAHRVAWHNGAGLAGAGWLASAGASGLVRVDWLQGRWMRGRMPYGSVEEMRTSAETNILM